jgi:predicted membrane protein DUF2238
VEHPQHLSGTVREHAVLAVFAACYLVAFVAYGLVTGADLTIAYAVIVTGIGVLVAFLQTRVRFSDGVLWCLALWGLLHMAGGLIAFGDAVLYNVGWGVPVLRYDRLVHVFGFGTTTVACWQTLRNRVGVARVTTAVAVLVWLGGMGVGALNEVVEFVMSQVAETNVGGFVNTGYDLIFNTLGCTAAAVWLRLRRSY